MLTIENIKVDHRLEPIDASINPVFSWLTQEGTGEAITYRLLVASSMEALDGDEGDCWDSGEQALFRNFEIAYEGKPLSFRTVYFVKLTLKTAEGEKVSSITHFETRIADSDWLGTWIGVPDSWNGGALSIRRALDPFDKKVKKARAYIAGIGYHEFYVNGKKISDAVLNPGVTDYDQTVLFCTYDITDELNGKGDVVGILLGYGWYGNRKLKAQFYIDFEDGTTYEAHSFSNYGWWFAKSPITSNSIYSGETYDSRIEDEYPGGFSSQKLEGGYNSHWFGGIHSQQKMGRLVPQEMNPIRVLGTYKGEVIKSFSEHDSVYDIKQNIAGWCRIKVEGERGSKVILRHGETLSEDRHVDQTNLRTAAATDTYVLKGDGIEEYAPRFTYHGFRYVEVIIEGKATLKSLVGEHVHSDNVKVGEFSCSDYALNALHKMAVITEENNETSILTDCPQRDERFGWLNDVSTRVFQTCYNFDMDRFFNKVDRDMSQTQDKEGAITDTAPYYTGGRPADTTSLSYLLLARESYRYYGDKSTIVENYEGHKAWVEYLLAHQKGYIMDYYYYADWVPCTSFNDGPSDGICISSYFLFWHLKVLSELAGIIEKEEDKIHYETLAEESRSALNKKYFHDGYYHEGTQCEDGMALSLGIVEDKNRQSVYRHLRESVVSHGYHITCGNQGYRHVMYELCEHGEVDLLIKVLKNPEYPGWGFMLASGATTVWERWEKENLATMNSFDHPMFGSYDATFYRFLAGIKINDIFSGDIEIAPKIPSEISQVDCSFLSARGKIAVSWVKSGEEVTYKVTIPASMRAKASFEGTMISFDGNPAKETNFVLTSGTHVIVTKSQGGR